MHRDLNHGAAPSERTLVMAGRDPSPTEMHPTISPLPVVTYRWQGFVHAGLYVRVDLVVRTEAVESVLLSPWETLVEDCRGRRAIIYMNSCFPFANIHCPSIIKHSYNKSFQNRTSGRMGTALGVYTGGRVV